MDGNEGGWSWLKEEGGGKVEVDELGKKEGAVASLFGET